MAVPTGLTIPFLHVKIIDSPGADHLLRQLAVATDTVVHDDPSARFLGHNGLPLTVRDKICRVLETVQGFKTVLHRCILVGHMTIVASRIPVMG